MTTRTTLDLGEQDSLRAACLHFGTRAQDYFGVNPITIWRGIAGFPLVAGSAFLLRSKLAGDVPWQIR